MKTVWIIMCVLAGMALPIQAGFNSRFGKILESPIYASLVSFMIGVISIAIFILISRQHVIWSGFKTAPWYVLFSGVLGAFYVTIIILAFPRIGPAITFGLVVLGQMIIAIVLEHYKILVVQQHSINIWKILGIVMIVGGVVVIRKF